MRIVGGAGDADLGVSGDEELFGLADIGAALEKLRGEASGDFGRVRLLGEPQAAGDGAWIVSEESANEILFLLNAAFEVGYLFAGCVDKLFGLADVEIRGIAMS